MARRRSTVPVSVVLRKANSFLRESPPKFSEMREGVASLLETILHETGNYRGFNYLQNSLEGPIDRTRRHYHGDEGPE